MPTELDTRVRELKTKLTELADENDRIISTITTDEQGDGSGNVVVSPDRAAAFRKNLEKAEEVKAELDLMSGQAEIKAYLDGAETETVAFKAALENLAKGRQADTKTIGEAFCESDAFKTFRKQGGYTMPQPWEVEGVDLGSAWSPRGAQKKDLWSGPTAGTYGGVGTGNPLLPFGLAPVQIDPIIPLPMRTVRVRDLFPVQQTNAAVIEFFRVTGFTNNASVVPDRTPDNLLYAMKPHSGLSFEGFTAPVRTIAHWETIHRNALDDVDQLQATVNNELLYGLRLAEDAQILNGTGTGEDLLGILNTPGIQGLSRASGDNYADAIRRAMTKSFLAYYEPTGVVLHPLDWEAIELLKTTFGQYILSTNVAVGAVKQVWRLPIVDTPAIAQGTALVGSFGIGATLYDRMQGNIRIAEQHADLFVRNAVVILAEERLALATKRPESFVRVTF